jgi:hypothetical protein
MGYEEGMGGPDCGNGAVVSVDVMEPGVEGK